jgi:hypothetical protein
MRYFILFLAALIPIGCLAQEKKVQGRYSSPLSATAVTFNADSTFEYVAQQHPIFYRWESLDEKGRWTLSGDTIILNPKLEKKNYVESELQEDEIKGEKNLVLTFNHIKRYIDADGHIVKMDTLQVQRLDYAFNKLQKKNMLRVTHSRSVRCTFAGYIPPERITSSRTTVVQKPGETMKRIFVGCFELQQTKAFAINNPNANHLTVNIYSNYYLDGEIRQVRILIKNDHVLYTRQNQNGDFEEDNIWRNTDAKLIKQKKDRKSS